MGHKPAFVGDMPAELLLSTMKSIKEKAKGRELLRLEKEQLKQIKESLKRQEIKY